MLHMMIDAHIHIFPPYRLKGAVKWIKRYIPWLEIDKNIDQITILSMLKKAGVTHFFNYVYPLRPDESRFLNEFNYNLSQVVDWVTCFGSVHPDNDDLADIIEEAISAYGLLGLKLHPFVQGFDMSHPKMDEICRIMSELKRPIVIHTGFEHFYQRKLASNDIEKILKKYPDLTLVIAHLFYPKTDEAFRLMKNYENVYLDVTNIMSNYQQSADSENIFEGVPVVRDGKKVFTICLDRELQELENFSHRIMFGSDFPVGMNDLGKMYGYVRELDISETAMNDLTYNTARRFVERFSPGSISFRTEDAG